MTLLVKNEENILEENLIFHKNMGIDGFIITDNMSTDNTKYIIEKYQKKGWILEVINEPAQNFNQFIWVNRMITLAIEKYSAEWIINSDADEFWHPKSRSLKYEIWKIKLRNIVKTLRRKKAINVLNCFWNNMVPKEENDKFWRNTISIVKTISDPEEYNLSEWNMYNFKYPKIIHQAKGFKSIAQGNHHIDIANINDRNSKKIVVYHFSIQNYNHFEKKVDFGGLALERNSELPENMGHHWRYWYNIFKEGLLFQEYINIIGRNHFNEFFKKGIIEHDYTIYNFFSKQK